MWTAFQKQMDRGGARGGGYTPPESPRAGAVRGPAGYSMHDGGHGATAGGQGRVYTLALARIVGRAGTASRSRM